MEVTKKLKTIYIIKFKTGYSAQLDSITYCTSRGIC
jgi:hypothetical protein